MRPQRHFRLRAYRAFFLTGLRRELESPATIATRAVLFAVVLLVFSRIWDAVAATGATRRTSADLVWYIVVTELVVLSFPQLHLEFEADIRNGDLVARLPQPVNYAGGRIAEAAGAMLSRLVVLAPVGIVCALVFAGGMPRDARGLGLAALLLIPAALLGVLFSAAIGISAIWLHDPSPVFWIWQKLAFALGGLLLPLEIYPHWLWRTARWTPFAAMLNGPGRMTFGFHLGDALTVAAQLFAWDLAGALFVAWLWRRALEAIDTSGG